jgi:hypothetical protein
LLNVNFLLVPGEVHDLCLVADAAAAAFLGAAERLERRSRTLWLRQAEHGYALCEVGTETWAECIRYMAQSGPVPVETALHRIIWVRDDLVGRAGSVVAQLHAEREDDRTVRICWNPRAAHDPRATDRWHADRIQRWLDECVFSWVLEQHRARTSFLRRVLGPRPTTSQSAIGLRTALHDHEWAVNSGAAFSSERAAANTLAAMITHYGHLADHVGVTGEQLNSIYALVADLANRPEVSDDLREQVARALPTDQISTELRIALEQVTAHATASSFVHGNVVQYALATLRVLLEGMQAKTSEHREAQRTRDDVAKALAGVYEYTRTRAYLERLRERRW